MKTANAFNSHEKKGGKTLDIFEVERNLPLVLKI